MEYSGTDNLEAMLHAENYNRYLLDLVLSARPVGMDLAVLDFGAGIGTFAQRLTAGSGSITCLEPDEAQSRLLRDQGFRVVTNLNEIPDGSLDFIYSLNVLEHIEDDAEVLDNLGKKLKPGGKMLIYVPAFQCLYSAMDRKVGHFRRYRKADLVDLMSGTNLIVRRALYVDSIGFFASLVYRLIGDRSGGLSVKSVQLYDRFVFPLSRVLDLCFRYFFGKNVYVEAVAPLSHCATEHQRQI